MHKITKEKFLMKTIKLGEPGFREQGKQELLALQKTYSWRDTVNLVD